VSAHLHSREDKYIDQIQEASNKDDPRGSSHQVSIIIVTTITENIEAHQQDPPAGQQLYTSVSPPSSGIPISFPKVPWLLDGPTAKEVPVHNSFTVLEQGLDISWP
jgi:hypothetical protein